MLIRIKKIIQMLDSYQKKQATLLILFMLIGMFFEMFSIGAIIPAFSLISDPEFIIRYPQLNPYISLFGGGQNGLIYASVIILLSIYFLKSVFLSFLAWYQTRFVFEFQAKLSSRLFKKYINEEYLFHKSNNSSILIRNIANETTQLSNGGVLCGLNVSLEMFVIIGIGSFLIYIEPFGALITITSLTFTALLFFFFSRRLVFSWGKQRQYRDGKRIQNIQQGIGGIKEIKLLKREKAFIKDYDHSNFKFAEAARKQAFLLNIPRLLIEFIAIVVLSLLIIVLISRGDSIESILPIIGVFAAAAFRLMPSVNRVLSNFQTFLYSAPVIDLISSELFNKNIKTETNVISNTNNNLNIDEKDADNKLLINNITFKYENSFSKVLDKVDIKIESGSMIGLIGESGSGKSTLVDIILGLVKPQFGKINFAGKDILEDLNAWHKKVGYVPQNIYLLDDSLKRNIALGLPDNLIDDSAILKTLEMVNLKNLVNDSSEGIEMIVGERGTKLSGGQLQRAGIARALYHNPSILILDEATSALDAATESRVMNSIISMKGKKTIIIIAHRLSTVKNCDYIYELSKGKIINQGKPEDVLKNEF